MKFVNIVKIIGHHMRSHGVRLYDLSDIDRKLPPYTRRKLMEQTVVLEDDGNWIAMDHYKRLSSSKIRHRSNDLMRLYDFFLRIYRVEHFQSSGEFDRVYSDLFDDSIDPLDEPAETGAESALLSAAARMAEMTTEITDGDFLTAQASLTPTPPIPPMPTGAATIQDYGRGTRVRRPEWNSIHNHRDTNVSWETYNQLLNRRESEAG